MIMSNAIIIYIYTWLTYFSNNIHPFPYIYFSLSLYQSPHDALDLGFIPRHTSSTLVAPPSDNFC
jgi:hypothetical protein